MIKLERKFWVCCNYFIDDKSTLKIKENSEAVITGRRTTKDISKKINLDGGAIRASISKQNVDFVFKHQLQLPL